MIAIPIYDLEFEVEGVDGKPFWQFATTNRDTKMPIFIIALSNGMSQSITE